MTVRSLSVIHVPCALAPKAFSGVDGMERQCQTSYIPNISENKNLPEHLVLALSPDPPCVHPLSKRLEGSSLLSLLPNLFLKVSNFASYIYLQAWGARFPHPDQTEFTIMRCWNTTGAMQTKDSEKSTAG
jgi:hypothetical protein